MHRLTDICPVLCVCVCVCERERERESVCVSELFFFSRLVGAVHQVRGVRNSYGVTDLDTPSGTVVGQTDRRHH